MTASRRSREESGDRSRTIVSSPVTHVLVRPRTSHEPRPTCHTWFAECLWGDVDDLACRRDLADVLLGGRPRPSLEVAVREASVLLAAYPGCLLVVLRLTGAAWLTVTRTRQPPDRLSSRALTRRASSTLTVVDNGSAR